MKKKHCNIMEWRKAETSWLADRENDRKVFRLINQKRKRGFSTIGAIRALIKNKESRNLMIGKSAKSWAERYCVWCKKRTSRR